MERLMTVKGMQARYGCSLPAPRKYLRQCTPHTENPLTAPEWAVQDWEDSRTVVPAGKKVELLKRSAGRVIVPRRR